nr:MAG TPA: hypothetical protein [Caudoviricetes sp.]
MPDFLFARRLTASGFFYARRTPCKPTSPAP